MLLNKRISVLDFIKTIKVDITLITFYAIIVGYLDQFGWLKEISIPIPITGVFGTAVALLLAFRTSQSYDRWWEARIVWGAIVNDSRTLIRQIQSFYPRSNDQFDRIVEEIAYRQIVWCYALGESLRKLSFSYNVKSYLEQNKINGRNIPNAILSKHSETVTKARLNGMINDLQQIQIDSTIARLNDSMGRCERIKNTVFPRSYSLLIHMIIYVFATMLPFGLSDDFLLVEIGLTIIIPVIFVAIEKTSILMQDPFENKPLDTPMTKLAETIEINLKEMIGDQDLPLPKEPDTYYVL